MNKTYAVVDNGIVTNVIIADEEFANMYSTSSELIGECIPYDEVNEDDTKVARIGELYINGLFVSKEQAILMKLIEDDRIEPLKSQILALNPNAKFPNDADGNSDGVATTEELQAYLKYLQEKALLSKFEG